MPSPVRLNVNRAADPGTQDVFREVERLFPLTPNCFGNMPACRVYRSTAQAIASGTITALALDSERYDDPVHPMHSTSINNSRITIAVPGIYVVLGNVCWAAGASSARECGLRLNGTTYIDWVASVGDAAITTKTAAHYRFVAGDYIELVVYQTSGGNLNVSAIGNYTPEFSATWLCP